MRPPFETFKYPTCRGSYALGSACGHCEKCTWERHEKYHRFDEEPPPRSNPETPPMKHSNQDPTVRLQHVFADDARITPVRDAQYNSSWKKRGGTSAYENVARKIDRITAACERAGNDIFNAIKADSGDRGLIDDIRDLRRYLALVEAEMLAWGIVTPELRVADLTERPKEYDKLEPHRDKAATARYLDEYSKEKPVVGNDDAIDP